MLHCTTENVKWMLSLMICWTRGASKRVSLNSFSGDVVHMSPLAADCIRRYPLNVGHGLLNYMLILVD